MSRSERAVELFRAHCNCSQALLMTFRQPDALSEENALRIASIFGGGTASTGTGLCGAAAGALLAISLKHGQDSRDGGAEARASAYALGRAFLDRFRSGVGSCTCRGILGVDIGIPEGLAQARRDSLFETRCVDAIRTAAWLLEEMI